MIDFKKNEEEVIEFWEKNNISDKVRNKSLLGKKKYYFMDGPPYANGHIHMGTALNKVLKDFALRSRRMWGMNVFDRPGYDTHGVPIELKVEKIIGVNSKKDIEDYGVDKFVSKCREFATKHIGDMNSEFENLGVWMDWDNPYLTLDDKYIEAIWWTFKKAHEKNLLFLGKYPVHACPRCETAVAFNEIEYKEQEDNSIFVKFPLKKKENVFLIIWTTTPWTLPGNTAVMVHPDYEYSELEMSNGEKWIVAKELVNSLMTKLERGYNVKNEFKGKDMEGWEYINPLSKNLDLPKMKNAYKVILSGRYVTLDAGTGLVHCAPGHGKEDYDASRSYDMDIISPVEISGKLTKETGKYEGKIARTVDSEIIEDLDKDGMLVYKQKYSHDYPICWRCKSPLLMVSVPQWFFRISSFHKKLISENKKVNWIPQWAGGRMEAWLDGISDWPISRQRYWGTPLPIWTCDECDSQIVVGSVKELEKLSGKLVKGLHKPEIDSVKIKCKNCNKDMKRVPEVLDVWFDSGVSSWAALDYPYKEDKFKQFWPADFNLEGTDQFRGWWNSQLILSMIAFDKKPFENVFVHGMVLDLGKKKMSKSLGNVVSPHEVIEKHGRDAMRFYFSLINAGENISYDEKNFKEIIKFFMMLFNIKNLISNDYNLKFENNADSEFIEDKWILSKLNNLIKETRTNYEGYLFSKNSELIQRFVIDDISRTYIQIVRDRINNKDKCVGDVLNHIISSVLSLLAPITPYLTEKLYNEMEHKEESIHLCPMIEYDKKKINEKIENEMSKVMLVLERGMFERDKNKVGLKWPLAKVVICGEVIPEKYFGIIMNQLNVKKIEIKKGKEFGVELDFTPNKELEAEGYAREMTRQVQAFRKSLGLNKTDKIELIIECDKETNVILSSMKEFISERVNANKLSIVSTVKERFKNNIDFKIKEKKGVISVKVL